MKKQDTYKCYTGSTGGYNLKKADSVANGEFFSFEIQVKRKDGKIYLKEISARQKYLWANSGIGSLPSESEKYFV